MDNLTTLKFPSSSIDGIVLGHGHYDASAACHCSTDLQPLHLDHESSIYEQTQNTYESESETSTEGVSR